MNKICVYAITKNESQYVEKWFNSMNEADYIVVLDTGSTDDTVDKFKQLQKQYPDKLSISVKTYDPWRFDVPRNDAMDLIPNDYNILISTDLDEILESGWGEILRNSWIEGTHSRAQYRYIWSHLEDGSNGREFRYNKIHSREWRWKYPVHELLCSTKTNSELYPLEEELDLFDKITLHHYPDPNKSRGNYLPLLELREKENKEDWYGLIYLTHEYYYRGLYQKCIDKGTYVLQQFKDKYSPIEQASCYLFIGDAYRALDNPYKAIECYSKAIEVDNTYRESYINLAKVYMDINQFNIAREVLKEALSKTYRHYTWLERDISWTYELYDCLSLACYYSDHKSEAICYAAIALSKKPTDERLKNNLNLCIANTSDSQLL